MSKARATGTRWESAVAAFLNENGFPAVERRALHGNQDRGDLAGLVGWVVECKATKSIDLGTAMKEAEVAARNAGVTDFMVVHKRRMKPVADAYATFPLWLATLLLRYREDALNMEAK